MHVELTIKNYRCFPHSNPLRFEVREGFTAFVGINNSGKSSILRFLYEFRGLFNTLRDSGQLLGLIRGVRSAFPLPQNIKDLSELFSDSTNDELTIQLEFPTASLSPHPQPSSVTVTVARNTNVIIRIDFIVAGKHCTTDSSTSYVNQALLLMQTSSGVMDFSVLTQPLTDLVDSVYIGAFRNAINSGANENYFDIAVGDSFIKLWHTYKSGDIKKQNELIHRVTRDISSIFELPLEINPTPDGRTLQIYVGERSFKLNELGAGIAQFILVLGTAAIKTPGFVLIDEPELNLHPSLQLSFLTTLASYARRGVLFSTHSIGLARATADRVYAVKRIQQGESAVQPIEGIPRYSEFLGELSFNGYQELGFDKILLVEGPTEVRTVQQFLRQLKKDHKIVLFQLGGNSMINGHRELELEELTRITKNISALIDSERSVAGGALDPSRQAFVDVCKRVGIDCHVLRRRATENYLTEAAVKSVSASPTAKALTEYEKLDPVSHGWRKSQNWTIARQMQLSDWDATDLHAFLSNL